MENLETKILQKLFNPDPMLTTQQKDCVKAILSQLTGLSVFEAKKLLWIAENKLQETIVGEHNLIEKQHDHRE